MQGAPGVPRATGSLTALSPALSVTCSIADVSDTCCTPRDPPCPARDGWNPRLAAMQQLSHSAVEPELDTRRPRRRTQRSGGDRATARTDAGNDDARPLAALGTSHRPSRRASNFPYRLRNVATRPPLSLLFFCHRENGC